MTFMVSAKSKLNDVYTAQHIHVLLDPGSVTSFVSSSAINKLKLTPFGYAMIEMETMTDKIEQKVDVYEVFISSAFDAAPFIPLRCLSTCKTKICTIPPIEISAPENISDIVPRSFEIDVDMLIGADYFYGLFHSIERIPGINNFVVFKTRLGNGLASTPENLNAISFPNVKVFSVVTTSSQKNDENANDREFGHVCECDCMLLKYFLSGKDDPMNENDDKALELKLALEKVAKSTFFDANEGKYVTEIDFADADRLCGNYRVAFKRLIANENSLLKRERKSGISYARMYEDAVYDMMSRGICVPDESQEKSGYVIPQSGIFKLAKESTKVRIVNDASSKDINGLSLNDVIMNPPNILPKTTEVLLQFRMDRFVFVFDIEKFYNSVLLGPSSQKYCRFLFRPFGTKLEPTIYRFNCNIFGEKAAGFRTDAVLRLHTEKFRENFPDAVKVITERRFVDDGNAGAKSESDLRELFNDVELILQTGGFQISKVSSNSKVLMQILPDKLKSTGFMTNFIHPDCTNAHPNHATLGMGWDPANDKQFLLNVNEVYKFAMAAPHHIKPTKRHVIGIVPRIYDVFQILAPFTVSAKLLLHNIWGQKIGWDEILPDPLADRWLKWVQEIPMLEQIQIERCVLPQNADILYFSLEAFSDASKDIAACAVYSRIETTAGEVKVSLLASKTRIPKEELSLPRKELSSAVLASETVADLNKVLKLDPADLNFWGDSKIVLAWLDKSPKSWQTWVGNRVEKVRQIFPEGENRRHVRSKANPADIPTRPQSIENDLFGPRGNMWFNGPDFLKRTHPGWRDLDSKTQTLLSEEEIIEVNKELRPVKIQTFSLISKNVQDKRVLSPARYEYLDKSIGTLSQVFSAVAIFLRAIKKKCVFSVNAVDNRKSAENYFWRLDQLEMFPEEFVALEAGFNVSSNSKLKNFDPFFDRENQLIRAGGRLMHLDSSFEFKHPIIAPFEGAMTRRYIERAHKKVGHLGLDTVRNEIRKTIWCLKPTRSIKSALNACVVCKKYRAQSTAQKMGPLPSVRVKNEPTIWQNTMVDFAGPIFVREHGRCSKMYIALFTCLETRALHAELCENMELSEFVRVFDIFTNVRNSPARVYSDNAQTFKSTSKFLIDVFRQWNLEQLDVEMNIRGIEWIFNVDLSPHRFACVERQVGLVKPILIKTIGKAVVERTEFQALLQSAVRCVNARPYTTVTADQNLDDSLPLTPQHFINGDMEPKSIPQVQMPEIEGETPKAKCTRRWNYRLKLLSEMGKKYQEQYLSQQIARQKWRLTNNPMKVNDLCLVKIKNYKKLNYPMARVIEAIPSGTDNLIRTYRIKLPGGKTLLRDTNQLCRLELDDHEVEIDTIRAEKDLPRTRAGRPIRKRK